MSRTLISRDAVAAAAKSGQPSEGMLRKFFVAEKIESIEGVDRTLKFIISTGAVDRDNDTVNALGWALDNFKKNPVVLWAHDYSQLPVGKCTQLGVEGGQLVATAEFASHAFAETVYQMLKGKFLNATSVGFAPKTYKMNEERGGLDFETQELLEFSIVPVPANPEALMLASAAGIDTAPVQEWAEAVLKGVGVQKVVRREIADPVDGEADPVRWNRQLSKAFDVDGEPLQPSKLLYGWVSRFLDTPVKDLYETTLHIGGAKMGSYLSAFEDALAAYKTDSVRSLSNDREVPPSYETVQLNSKQSRSFLVDGVRFLSGPMRLVAQVQPDWSGVAITLFCPRAASDKLLAHLGDVQTRAASLKFLKGEAFSLSGEFLSRGSEVWEDLFLAPVNLDPIKRTTQLLNEQGKDMDSRGMILMGPPGTGKTLAGRVMMNAAKDATFVWLSARDLYRMGMSGGFMQAMDVARENAPAVVFVEDIDAHLDSYSIDLMKTELDGIKQAKGVVTILTTNFPKSLPEALIDRPGRFHDVLQLDLPTEALRREMLSKWAPDAPTATLDKLAKDTLQFSGAHLRDLVRYANVLRAQDSLTIGDALARAFDKVKSQRDLIDATRANGRQYRAVKALSLKHGTGECDRCGAKGALAAGVCGTCAGELHGWTAEATLARTAQLAKEVKRGRVLSSANEGRLRRAKDILEEVLAQIERAPVENPADDEPKPVAARESVDPAKDGLGACSYVESGDGTPCAMQGTEKCVNCGAVYCAHHCSPHGTCMNCMGTLEDERTLAVELGDEPEVALVLREADIVIDLDGTSDDEAVELSFDPDELRTVLREQVAELVGQVVRAEATAALNRARGRVD